jgi:hypothetical protein
MRITRQRLNKLAEKIKGLNYKEELPEMSEAKGTRMIRIILEQLKSGYMTDETEEGREAIYLLEAFDKSEHEFSEDSQLLTDIKQFLKKYENNKTEIKHDLFQTI